MKGDEQVWEAIKGSTSIYLSVFVIGELLVGFKGGNKKTWNKECLFRFLRKPNVIVLQLSLETAEQFAEIKNLLKKSENLFLPMIFGFQHTLKKQEYA